MSEVTTVTGNGVSAESLVDALDRIIAGGVAASGDVIIGVAGIDLIRLDLRLLLVGLAGTDRPGGVP